MAAAVLRLRTQVNAAQNGVQNGVQRAEWGPEPRKGFTAIMGSRGKSPSKDYLCNTSHNSHMKQPNHMASTRGSLALFGATGNTGKAVLALALEQGYAVRALVRSPEKVGLEHDKLTLLQGGYDAVDMIKETVKGCEYVICVAGEPMGGPGKYPQDLMLNFVKNLYINFVKNLILAIKDSATTKCFLYQAGFLAATPKEQAKGGLPWGTWLARSTVVKFLEPNLQDHEAVMRLLEDEKQASDLTWVVSLPPTLSANKGEATRTLEPADARSFALNMGGITFDELAALTLKAVQNEALYGTHIFASKA